MKVLNLVLAVLLACVSLVYAEKLATKVDLAPKVFTVTPQNSRADLVPSLYPEFSNCTGESDCCGYLGGLSNSLISGKGAFSQVPGLSYALTVPEGYRANGSVLVAWTIRIEASDPGLYGIWPGLCKDNGYGFHGSVNQTFKGGLVQSQANIQGKLLGNPSEMTIPDGGSGTVTVVSDPTHSGSYVVKAADFTDGKLPASIDIKVYWKNNTSRNIFSLANYRSLIITLLPNSD